MVPALHPFRIDIPEAQLADLRQRLNRTRWPEPETVTDWSQGIPLAYVRELCGYWGDGYDWRATERRLNGIPQFTTDIDGLSVHFLHVRSPHPGALPLVLTHGWPGSVVEFLKVLGPLTDPVAHGGTRLTRSTWCARPCLVTGSAPSPAPGGGGWRGSPPPGAS